MSHTPEVRIRANSISNYFSIFFEHCYYIKEMNTGNLFTVVGLFKLLLFFHFVIMKAVS